MKLSEIKSALSALDRIGFRLPDGQFVPGHFHVTEIGKVTKDFIDCGGKVRHEERVNFQLWEADDYDHRLHPEKLVHIIQLSEKALGIGDLEIEVEYQGDTIGKYGLDFDGINFLLIAKQTDCLAREKCGNPLEKQKTELSALSATARCEPGSGCCN